MNQHACLNCNLAIAWSQTNCNFAYWRALLWMVAFHNDRITVKASANP